MKIDVAANTRICIPVILDLVARQVIWADLALRRNPRWSTNVEGNQKGMLLIGQALTNLLQNAADSVGMRQQGESEPGRIVVAVHSR